VFNRLATYVTLASFAAVDRLKKEEKGATAVEYGLLVGLIAVAIIATVLALGGELNRLFEAVRAALAAIVV
jgi:pilus assembly protein Flp/PilA